MFEEKLHTPENSRLTSPYAGMVEKRIHTEAPQEEEKLMKVIKDVDKQGSEHFDVFESSGATFPYTRVSVNEVVGQEVEEKTENEQSPKNWLYVIMPGFATPSLGHPFTPWDMVYDRVFQEMSRVKNASTRKESIPKVEVVVIGSPLSSWGKVSETWVDKVAQEGFSAHGKAISEFLENYPLAKDPNTRIVLNGISMSAMVFEEVMKNFKFADRSKALYDNPVGDHPAVLRALRAVNIGVGFAAESAARMSLDDRTKQVVQDEAPFLAQLEEDLKKKGIETHSTPEDLELKWRACKADIFNVVKGQPITVEDRRYIRKGLFDPTSPVPNNLIRESYRRLTDFLSPLNILRGEKDMVRSARNPFTTDGKKLTGALNQTHTIDRVRISRWIRSLNSQTLDPSESDR
jgi:hypothetical protein